MEKICVVGATSPLGTTLVPALADAGYDVAATYRRSSITAEHERDTRASWHELDLATEFDLPDFDIKTVVWLAHLDAGRYNEHEPASNLAALERFLKQVSETSIEAILFISSGGSVYGHPQTLPIPESHRREPASSYGIAKRVMEDRLLEFGRGSGQRIAILRPGNIYGFERPSRRTKGVIGAFLNAIAKQEPFTLIHGGRTIRDLIHVDDVCNAVKLAIESEAREIIWNVGTGQGIAIRKVLELILRKTGSQMPELIERENFSTDVLESVLSVAKIHRETGWSAQIELEDGISATLAHWNLHRSSTRS